MNLLAPIPNYSRGEADSLKRHYTEDLDPQR